MHRFFMVLLTTNRAADAPRLHFPGDHPDNPGNTSILHAHHINCNPKSPNVYLIPRFRRCAVEITKAGLLADPKALCTKLTVNISSFDMVV
jgi:hypothetical protein